MAAFTIRSGMPGLVRSPAKTAVPPSISPAACSATSPSRSLIRTLAPSLANSSAVARPIPRAEPVMIALFPSSNPKGFRLLLCEGAPQAKLRGNPFSAGRGFLPKPVGGDPVCDDRPRGVGHGHIAEAEAATAFRHPGL